MATKQKPLCKYGSSCYQKNKIHLDKYLHPDRQNKHQIDDEPIPSTNDAKRQKRSQSKSPTDDKIVTKLENVDVAKHPNKENDEIVTEIPQKDDTESSENTKTESISDELRRSMDFIMEKFLVKMPKDFIIFWQYCEKNTKKNTKPEDLFMKFGLKLCGPFDVLSGRFANAIDLPADAYLRHCRYYYDPPEFQTIFRKDKTAIHYGYWRDAPNDEQCFIVKNNPEKNCEIIFVADNIFSAICHFLDTDATISPFNAGAVASTKKSLNEWATANSIEIGSFAKKLRARNMKCVTKTLHCGGLVVPVEKKTAIGYRPLIETDANLKKILRLLDDCNGDREIIDNVMVKLYPLITAANIAVDEGDYGNSIELGLNLFCCGAPEMHSQSEKLLEIGYQMAEHVEFVEIIKAHLANRKRGNCMSIV